MSFRTSLPLFVVLSLGAACSANTSGGTNPSGGSGGSGANAGSGGNGGTGASTGGQGGTGNGVGGGIGLGGGTGGIMECTGVSASTEPGIQPADIIIAVDTSGSMDEESAEVQQNLNNFASIITASGIDVHVILIADTNTCIPGPLGSGACGGGDTNLPNYLHVNQGVASTDALQLIISTYPQWKDSLRPNATKNFVVVSDDESAISAADFTNQLLALDPPTFQGFFFHSIVASNDGSGCFGFSCPAGNPCCVVELFACISLAADQGAVYQQLSQQTGGVNGDLCLQDFDPVFNQLATGVVTSSTLSCNYPIPVPPDGQMIDPALVNVTFDDGSTTSTIYNVPGGLADCGASGGWYYDDPQNPTEVIMCPSTCNALQGVVMGTVSVVFGCATEIVPN